MSLPVPLTVRIGDQLITRQVSDVAFRKEAVGGLRNITINLAREIESLDANLTPFTKVYLYDARTAEIVAEGRLSDLGRAADPSGQAWDLVAFGPIQHASDLTAPLIYADRSIGEGWAEVDRQARAKASVGSGTKPGDATSATSQGLLASFDEGSVLLAGHYTAISYSRVSSVGMKLARVSYAFDAGLTDASWLIDSVAYTNGVYAGVASTNGATTAGGTASAVVVTNFTNGCNEIRLIWNWNGSTTTTPANAWAFWDNIAIRTMLYDKAGVEITTGYTADTILASEVVADLLGRWLDQYDGANATVATTSLAIPQLTYPDGVNSAQVLEDMMRLEPAYRWYTTPNTTGNGYGFRWELWPTAVRYEVTLEDGGSFPLSAQDIYNAVNVQYKDIDGTTRNTVRVLACPLLDDAGISRRATIDAGSEVGGLANAQAAGDAFLITHNVPRNQGTLKIARPIRDLTTGAMVDPHMIEAGELIRVKGVESYTDSLNADGNDGQTVFRIFAMDYASADNTASLSLDADPTDVASILAKLLTDRARFSTRRQT